jgi:ABC-type uncharacterized transport system permease subunit
MGPGVNMLCFTASYLLALGLETLGLWTRARWRWVAIVIAASAGVIAHTWYLGRRVLEIPSAPLSSHHDWYLVAAWLLAVVYLGVVLYQGRGSLGLFVLPLTLGLIVAAYAAATQPLAAATGTRFWAQLHAVLLMLGAIAVLLGFIAGVMYLLQSHRLKRKQLADDRFRLPTLEWLERANSRSLGIATACVGLGFVTGVVVHVSQRGGRSIPWTDPVVLSLGTMLVWLVVAEGLRLVYPAARRGRKVAYLTLAAFAFLVLTLFSFTLRDSLHQVRDADLSQPASEVLAAPGEVV